ncbi:polysaccharide deacetylase family protein [Mesorhizobium sp. NBSH29]|uniref:polysaccharide deacetylase family protein n=1 Tax=Mesorhizobium sp. NBSH29 TaxID=2654249 RepID=UPI001896950B|nr:polysaccharide deacetylase family protein [Mesorhizobium sp. NBSH29]QPC85894.1 polysaccharide deacetylase family protein [Mesorhizobium sp. NBSH29]
MKALLKQIAITGALEAIALTRAGRIFPGAAGRGIIFTLHHVRPAENRTYEPNAVLSLTPEFLEKAILETRAKGYEAVALSDLRGRLDEADATRRFVAFTLDDGLRDNAKFAAPVFRKHDVPYTIFLTKGLVERTRTMWWETAEVLTRQAHSFAFDFGGGPVTVVADTAKQKHEAFLRLARFVEAIDEDAAVARIDQAAFAAGIDPKAIVEAEIMDAAEIRQLGADPLAHFGAHTLTHCNLARVSPERLADEISESISAIERWTGSRPVSLAYPYGWGRACGVREAEAAAKAGLRVAVTTQPGVLKGNSDNWMLLPRVSLNGLYQKRRYVRALLSGIPFGFM